MSSSVPALDPAKLDACVKAADALAIRMDAMCGKRADGVSEDKIRSMAKEYQNTGRVAAVYKKRTGEITVSLDGRGMSAEAAVEKMKSVLSKPDSLDGKFQHHKGKDNVRPA